MCPDGSLSCAMALGWYRTVRMEEIELACNAVWNGAGLYAVSLVPFFATAQRRVQPHASLESIPRHRLISRWTRFPIDAPCLVA